MKWVKRIGIVVVVLVVVAAVAGYIYKDAVVKRGVIFGGNSVLGEGSTALSSASLDIFGGGLSLSGLKLDNPTDKGFKQPHFFELGQTDVNVSLGTLMDDKVVIPQVTLDGLAITAELVADLPPKLNLIAVKKIVDESVGGTGDEPAPDPKPADKEGKKFVIKELTVTNATITFAGTMPGGASLPAPIPLPDFTLNDIGEKENGVVLKELVAIVLDGILSKAIEAVGGIGNIGLDAFEGGADALRGIGEGLLQGGGDLGGDAGKAIEGILGGNKKDEGSKSEGDSDGGGDIGKAIGDGIGGLLGGKKDEEKKEE